MSLEVSSQLLLIWIHPTAYSILTNISGLIIVLESIDIGEPPTK